MNLRILFLCICLPYTSGTLDPNLVHEAATIIADGASKAGDVLAEHWNNSEMLDEASVNLFLDEFVNKKLLNKNKDDVEKLVVEYLPKSSTKDEILRLQNLVTKLLTSTAKTLVLKRAQYLAPGVKFHGTIRFSSQPQEAKILGTVSKTVADLTNHSLAIGEQQIMLNQTVEELIHGYEKLYSSKSGRGKGLKSRSGGFFSKFRSGYSNYDSPFSSIRDSHYNNLLKMLTGQVIAQFCCCCPSAKLVSADVGQGHLNNQEKAVSGGLKKENLPFVGLSKDSPLSVNGHSSNYGQLISQHKTANNNHSSGSSIWGSNSGSHNSNYGQLGSRPQNNHHSSGSSIWGSNSGSEISGSVGSNINFNTQNQALHIAGSPNNIWGQSLNTGGSFGNKLGESASNWGSSNNVLSNSLNTGNSGLSSANRLPVSSNARDKIDGQYSGVANLWGFKNSNNPSGSGSLSKDSLNSGSSFGRLGAYGSSAANNNFGGAYNSIGSSGSLLGNHVYGLNGGKSEMSYNSHSHSSSLHQAAHSQTHKHSYGSTF